MENLYNYTKKDLEDYLVNMGAKKFNATQIIEWIYKKRVSNIDSFSNVNKDFRENLKNIFELKLIKIRSIEKDKDVSKYLFELFDGEFIEAVLMRHSYGLSICVSSQVGCNMGCKFCDSGTLKKIRNLEVSEMVSQILLIEDDIKERISSVVIMGIGEPFDNYDNVMKFITICNEPKGLEIGARHITVSTCGLVPKIDEFANFPLQVNLALSLHAPNDEIRSDIMPVNKVYSINEVIRSLKKYIEKTKRRVTIEYVLLKGVNDSKKNAVELAMLLESLNVYVNLIYYNKTSTSLYDSSLEDEAMMFCDVLKRHNVDVTIRRKFGNKISAACGQLRSKEVNNEN